MRPQTLFAVLGVFVGCADHSPDSDGPAFDASAPRVHIVSPVRGTFAGDIAQVLVTGTVNDDSGAAQVTVNGVPAAVSDDGMWLAKVDVVPGTNLLQAIAIDAKHNKSTETRAIVVGPMVALDRPVAGGIRASLSTPALNTLGSDIATFIETGGLMVAAQERNPVLDVGTGPCLYAQAAITNLSIADAEVTMEPTTAGISVSIVLDNVSLNTHLQWAVSCTADNRDVLMTAQRVMVRGLLTVDVANRELDVQFDHPNVQVTGFDLQATDLPENIAQMLQLDTAVSTILGLSTERMVVPMVDRSLAALDQTTTIDVAGVEVDVDVAPLQISFTPEGGMVSLDTSLRARGDKGQFVFVPNVAPKLEMKSDLELAVADDAANQLLTSLWSARAFDTEIELASGAYGKIGDYYDSVQLQLVVPPHVEATGSPLELTVGDLIATFKRGNDFAASVAIHAKNALYVVEDGDGKLRVDVATPAVDVDVVSCGDSFTKAEYQAIKTFALERVRTLGSAAVGAIPLPEVGNATPATPWLTPTAGYLFVAGDVH